MNAETMGLKRKGDEEVSNGHSHNNSDDEGFEIPKEHLRLAKKRLKVSKPEATIQKSQSKTTIFDIRNLLAWVLSESHGSIPRWCVVRNKNLVTSMTVVITPFVDRHTLFECAGNSAGLSMELPFFSHAIRGSLIPMSPVSFRSYPTSCPVLTSLLSSPSSGKNPAAQWIDKLSDNEEEDAAEVTRAWRIAEFLMSEENCRANDIPELLAGGRIPPGFVGTAGKKTRLAHAVPQDETPMVMVEKDLERLAADPDYSNLVGIDCEMVDTIAGKELARVSLVNQLGVTLYDSIVLPENEVTDYLTQYSGITPKMLRECKTSLKDAQRNVLDLLDENSILVGHSIDNDLKCLKLIHSRIIDTSDIFPHPNGHPSKHSLVFLLQRVLRESLDREGGHDSVDDARAALRIAMKKLARGPDYAPMGMGTSKQIPLGAMVDGRIVLHAEIPEFHRYKLEGLHVNPTEVQETFKLRIHHLKHYQVACENNTPRKEALVATDLAVRQLISTLSETDLVLVFSGCGDVHAFKKFETLLNKCEDEDQRIEVTKALQRAKDKAVAAFAIISAVGDLPDCIRGMQPQCDVEYS